MSMAPRTPDDPSTVIFVDVDGVLNVGIRDDDGPLLLNDTWLGEGESEQGPGSGTASLQRGLATRLKPPEPATLPKVPSLAESAVRARTTCGRVLLTASRATSNNESYSSVACKGHAQLAGLFLSRLARLIKAEPCPMVVLSSKWQEHESKVMYLEIHGRPLPAPR
eukprot:g27919.t1